MLSMFPYYDCNYFCKSLINGYIKKLLFSDIDEKNPYNPCSICICLILTAFRCF